MEKSISKLDEIKELVELLNRAGESYYSKGVEIMTNYEYDRLYERLQALEKSEGIVLTNSPTVNVGYEVLSELPKERHESPMLSLDKTKSADELAEWLGDKKGLLSWKLDGLTIVLTYENGELVKAVTRGNGEVGEIITNNARVFKNIPLTIACREKVIVRGEAIITYSDFEKINEAIPETDARYKNPRNLCSGSVRQLNNQITAQRNVQFYAFNLVAADIDFDNSRECQFEWLKKQGFSVVEYKVVYKGNVVDTVEWFEQKIASNDFPSDGLVILYDDIAYGDSLGRTAKFPRNSMAFKWSDETAQTRLRYIEWSASRTGLINPVAVFEPVELEGTSVSRASVHNVSIVEELELGEGDEITVFKANMIIPQIADNLTRSGKVVIPSKCPVCGHDTRIEQSNSVKALYCTNPECQAKHVKSFVHFASRDAMNIEGMSEATLEKFIQKGILKSFRDIYSLSQHKDIIVNMDGFGEKSYNKLTEAVERSRNTTMARCIYSMGIPNIGISNAKMILKKTGTEPENIMNIGRSELEAIDGVGSVIADTWVSFFEDAENREMFMDILSQVNIEQENKQTDNQMLLGKTIVITGSVEHFSNRNELKAYIEELGGKVTGSVTKNTDYLINNDSASASSKNKTAHKLGVAIITENEFLEMVKQG